MWLFLFVVQGGILLHMMRRFRAYQAVIMCSAYVLLMQVTFYVASNDGFDAVHIPTYLDSHYYYFSDTMFVYLGIFILLFVSTIGIRGSTRTGKKIDVQRALEAAARTRLPLIAAIAINALLGLCFVLFDWDIVLRNQEYLLMTGSRVFNAEKELASLLIGLLSYSSIIVAVLVAMCLAARKFGVVLLLTPALLFLFLFYLSAHSRYSTAQAFAFGAILFAARFRYKFVALLTIGFLVFFSLVFSLQGRSHNLHGLATLFDSLKLISFNDLVDGLIGSVLNMMQGIFATGDALMIEADHHLRYRVLSFSPFPSFIDGFQEVLECCEIRVNVYAPMSAISEVISFGLIYTAIFVVVLFTLFRMLTRLTLDSPTIYSLLVNIFVFVNFLMSNAYPVRHVFRLYLLAIVMVLVARRFSGFLKRRSGLA